MGPLTPRERLNMIALAIRHCDTVVTREALRVQFHYETGVDPNAGDLDHVMRWVAREAERA